MGNFYQWLAENQVPADFQKFELSCLDNPEDGTPWLVAGDWADDNDMKCADKTTGSLLRAIGTLCQYGMDEAEKVSAISQTPETPGGRMDLIKHCVSCIPWFQEWRKKRTDLSPFLWNGIIPDELEDYLPHGSGIDSDWQIDFNDATQNIECVNAYHAMDENGVYAGWVRFQVEIPAIRPLDFNVVVNEQDVARIDAAYAAEEPNDWAPYLDNLDEVISEEVRHSLQRYFNQ